MRQYYVYILASQRNGTLYTGVTNDLVRRVCEHREGLEESFTKRYGVHALVYDTPGEAITREKQIKKWNRKWKLSLIEAENPDWVDLYPGLLE